MGIIDIDIDTRDFDLKITSLRSGMGDIGDKMIRDVTHTLFRELQAITPVKTGKLLRSETEQTFGTRGEVRTNSGYGLFVDVDTQAHEIVGNPFLRFPVGDKMVVVRRVLHPGTKGQKLRLRTLRNSRPKVKDILARLMHEVIGA